MKAKACTECRQNKLRCLYPPNGIGSCQRCLKKDIACVFDPKFRRVSKRKLAQSKKRANGLNRGESTTPVEGDSSVSPSDDMNGTSSSAADPPQLNTFKFPKDGPMANPGITVPADQPEKLKVIPSSGPKQIKESITISAEEINTLFDVFMKNHLYYMPLDICLDCEAVYERCPILFWAILAIAGRDFPLLPHIQLKVKDLLKGIILEAVRSVEIVQALLLIASWPFPYRSQLDDQSFTCATLAVQYSLRLGLHRPNLSHEFSSRPEVLQFGPFKRLTTWMGCFVVCSRESMRHGVPNLITPDFTLRRAFDDTRIPLRLRNLCQLAYQSSVMNNTLGSSGENFSGLMEPVPRLELVKQYIGKLNSLYTTESFVRTRDPYVEVVYLTTRLQVLSYILTDDILDWSTEALQFMNIAMNDASRMIRVESTIPGLEFAPIMLFRYVVYASLVLLRILRECDAVSLDRKAILSDLTLAYQILDKLYSKVRNDEHIVVTKNFLQVYSTLTDTKVTQPIKSRGPANILYDAVRVTREAQAVQLKQQQHERNQNDNVEQDQQLGEDPMQNGASTIVSLENSLQPRVDPNFVPPDIDDQWLTEIFNLVYYM